MWVNLLFHSLTDDIVLMDGDRDSLQRTLDSFAAFCTAYGLEISLNKTKIMQFLPTRRRGQAAPRASCLCVGKLRPGDC